MSERFNKAERLLNKADYGHTFKIGSKIHGKLFMVVTSKNTHVNARLGIAVSRKVSLRAVVRNRIKRQIRESFRLNKNVIQGRDCIVIAKKKAADMSKSEIRSSLDSLWQKISDDS